MFPKYQPMENCTMNIIPSNDILVVSKIEKDEISSGGLYLGKQADEPVVQCKVTFANEAYGFKVGDILLVPVQKLLASKVNGALVYFVKVTDILGELK